MTPRLKPFSFGGGPLKAGEHATVQCSVIEGDRPLKLAWTFHGRDLSASETELGIETVKIGKKTNLLSIESVSEKHTGNYTCIASNPYGYTNYTAQLIVRGTHVPCSILCTLLNCALTFI